MATIETIRKILKRRRRIAILETITYTLLAVCYCLLFVYVFKFVL